jgi:hypothetical protein
MPFLQFVAVLCTGLFAGAAIYINIAEAPARALLDVANRLAQWAPSYSRATWMQAPLAIGGCLCAVTLGILLADWRWIAAGVCIGAVVPFTFIAIMPTNRRLMAEASGTPTSDAPRLLTRWSRLHAVRSVLSTVAFAIMLWASR